jgi:hypothetical protein
VTAVTVVACRPPVGELSLWDTDFILFGYRLRSGIVRSYGSPIFSFLRNPHTVMGVVIKVILPHVIANVLRKLVILLLQKRKKKKSHKFNVWLDTVLSGHAIDMKTTREYDRI